ncbi:hypothetical protein L484_008059 [Morus notabilis]|uniref:Uncharacterized protein n=1 Tax=Morus notabilis TaxID=981085 RepID=W9QRZ7_9ROSA|nr:hypothetical protein L484_008059 [Morus notabilis]
MRAKSRISIFGLLRRVNDLEAQVEALEQTHPEREKFLEERLKAMQVFKLQGGGGQIMSHLRFNGSFPIDIGQSCDSITGSRLVGGGGTLDHDDGGHGLWRQTFVAGSPVDLHDFVTTCQLFHEIARHTAA